MLPHAITVEIEKKDARKHQCGPKGYCTVTDFTERLAQPSPDKWLYPGLKRQIQESFQPKKVKTNTKKRKAWEEVKILSSKQ